MQILLLSYPILVWFSFLGTEVAVRQPWRAGYRNSHRTLPLCMGWDCLQGHPACFLSGMV